MTPDRFARIYARMAIGSAFLSAVASRFGLWPGSKPGSFGRFIAYTGQVNAFMPRFTIPFLAIAATFFETLLGLALIAGIRVRWTALAAAVLLAMFGTAMAISFGIKEPLDYSVFSASAGALLLSLWHERPFTRARRDDAVGL